MAASDAIPNWSVDNLPLKKLIAGPLVIVLSKCLERGTVVHALNAGDEAMTCTEAEVGKVDRLWSGVASAKWVADG